MKDVYFIRRRCDEEADFERIRFGAGTGGQYKRCNS
jgi:hypothetical protein